MNTADKKLVSELVDCNFMDVIPDDVCKLVANVRRKYVAFREEYAIKMENERKPLNFFGADGRAFGQYYNRPGKKNPLKLLREDKRNLVIELTMEMLAGLSEDLISSVASKAAKEGGISKNQVRKKNRKERQTRKQRKRRVGKKNHQQNESTSSCDDTESSDDEKYTAEAIQKELEGIIEDVGYTEKARTEKIKQLVVEYEVVENALIELISHPYFESRESVCNQFSAVIESLVSTKYFSTEKFKKMKGMVDVLSQCSSVTVYDFNKDKQDDFEEQQKKRCKKLNINLPPRDDQENFARKFMESLLKPDLDENQEAVEMASIIQREHLGNLLKQKVVEIGMYDLLKILKSSVINHQLYIAETIFKATMGLPCARKYCWRDSDYFSTLCNLLTVVDTNPKRDKYQVRDDAVHIVYTSILASPREVFEQVAKTSILENLVQILKTRPTDVRGAFTGTDAILSITLMSEYWDLFEAKVRRLDVIGYLKKWRKHALYYSNAMPDFEWNLENLCLRLKVLLKSDEIKVKRPDFRVSAPQLAERARKFIKTYNQTACSNPKCFQLNDHDNEDRYKKCSKCNLSYYCTKQCQSDHWTMHKIWCKRPSWNKKASNKSTPRRKLANQSPVDEAK